METTYRDYWEHVNAIASEILEEVKKEATLEDAEERVNELIAEAADGDYFVIYTHAAAAGLQHSDNESAFFDEYGSLEADSYGEALSSMMAAALGQDIAQTFASDELEAHFEDE